MMANGETEDGTHEEKVPINTMDHEGDHDGRLRDHDLGDPDVRDIVVKGPPKRKPGCFISRGLCVFIIILVVIIIAIAGAAVGYFLRCWKCDATDGSIDALYAPSPKPTVAPGLPWSGIRLPRDLIPKRYTVGLKVDLEQFVFSGSVVIEVDCKRSTNYMITHSNALMIDDSKVSIHDVTNNAEVPIVRQVRVPINQFHVLETEQQLVAGNKYRINFGRFTGKLLDDLRGIYRSSYKDQNNNTR